MTHNGMENSKEHMFRITAPEVVEALIQDFEAHWLTCQPLTDEEVDQVIARHQTRQDDRNRRSQEGQRSSPSRSQPRES